MREKPGTVMSHREARLLLALAAAGLLCAGAAGAEGSGRCVTAIVPWAFELPDGSVYPAGPLTLCLSRVYDPVTGLHELRVERRPVGLFMSRFGEGEATSEAIPVVVFEARGGEPHKLAGYAWPGRAGLETYRFYDPRATREERLLARAPLLESDASQELVFLAALPKQR